MTQRWSTTVRAAALVVPVATAAAAGAAHGLLANSGAALVLVLVVVAAAVVGDRLAGVLAAVSAAASFDFFLTEPHYRFTILQREDLETALLLLAIGVAVTAIVGWGRRAHAESGRRGGYLAGVGRAARLAADGSATSDLTDTITDMISQVLDLDACRFEPPGGPADPDRPVLHRDGTISWAGRTVDVRREGLPGMDVIELPAGRGGEAGRFLLTSSTRDRRPDPEQLLVAVTLAEQVPVTPVAAGRRHHV
jgi:K+-sensing histidine kinase KdpD